jgi:hypothetical protein
MRWSIETKKARLGGGLIKHSKNYTQCAPEQVLEFTAMPSPPGETTTLAFKEAAITQRIVTSRSARTFVLQTSTLHFGLLIYWLYYCRLPLDSSYRRTTPAAGYWSWWDLNHCLTSLGSSPPLLPWETLQALSSLTDSLSFPCSLYFPDSQALSVILAPLQYCASDPFEL